MARSALPPKTEGDGLMLLQRDLHQCSGIVFRHKGEPNASYVARIAAEYGASPDDVAVELGLAQE